MEFQQIFEVIRGEGGVIAILLLAVVVFFRGGIVTGKAYEATVKAYEARLADKTEDIRFWRDKALRALEAGEKLQNERDERDV